MIWTYRGSFRPVWQQVVINLVLIYVLVAIVSFFWGPVKEAHFNTSALETHDYRIYVLPTTDYPVFFYTAYRGYSPLTKLLVDKGYWSPSVGDGEMIFLYSHHHSWRSGAASLGKSMYWSNRIEIHYAGIEENDEFAKSTWPIVLELLRSDEDVEIRRAIKFIESIENGYLNLEYSKGLLFGENHN
jgi:hypothetical protein